jgi:hypothetical protein
VVTVNSRPDICEPIAAAFRENDEYLVYNPDAPDTKFAKAGPLAGTWDSLQLPEKGSGARRLTWDEELSWESVHQVDPERFSLFGIEGGEYASTYTVYKGYGYIDSLAAPVKFYKFVPRSPLSSRRLPEIFMADDKSALSRAINGLAANDLVTKGWRSYPVVRRPGRMVVYEIGLREDVVPAEYGAAIACDIWSAPALERASQGLPVSAPAGPPPPTTGAKKYAVCDTYANFPDVYAACHEAQARLFRFPPAGKPKPKNDFVYNR